MRGRLAILLTCLMVLVLAPAASASSGSTRGPAPGSQAAEDAGAVPGSYIVVLASGDPSTVAAEHSRAHDAAVTFVYRSALRGYAARLSDRAAARIAADPRVAYLDVDRIMTVDHHVCGHTHPRHGEGACDPEPPGDEIATYTVSGTVTDAGTKAAIANATVTVGSLPSAQTDLSGAYTVTGVPAGESYTVTAVASGYQTASTTTGTVDANTTGVDLALTAAPPSQQVKPWGIARVGAPLAGNTGGGIDVYVIDTGIDHNHPDLKVMSGVNCSGGSPLRASCTVGLPGDDNGHGTHVAGTIAALDNTIGVVGVAPNASLHAVKVLRADGAGYRSWIIAGIDWIVKSKPSGQAVVANMSIGGSGSKSGTCTKDDFTGSDSYHQAICTATRSGVVFAVSAGNSGADAAGSVPAAYDDSVITVSATNSASDWPSWSNWGKPAPVALAAPGVGVLSTRAGGGTVTYNGTSMAAPHVAGAAALFLKRSTQTGEYSAYVNARADLTSKAQVTWNGSTYTNSWTNTSGNPHHEGFVQVGHLE
jgi:subtilisin